MKKIVFFVTQLLLLGCSEEESKFNRTFEYDANASHCEVVSPPSKVKINEFYQKYCSLYGVPIVSSRDVSDEALKRAWHIANEMVGHHHEYLKTIAQQGIVIAIIGKNENISDIPEYAGLDPKYWNARARGLGATSDRPAISGAEENLLCLNRPNDRYQGENIFVHEWSHTVHEFGIRLHDNSFQSQLDDLYDNAFNDLRSKIGFELGLYPMEAYAMVNATEYWAEGVQSYYNVESAYPVTAGELSLVDPSLYRLIDSKLKSNTIADVALCPID